MTNTDIILAQIKATPGLTDAELIQRTGVRPHQQVNAICNWLQSRGLIRRALGPAGAIINVAVNGSADAIHSPEPERSVRLPRASLSSAGLADVARLDPTRTLLVIPCSGSKAHGGNRVDGASLCTALPSLEARALSAARERVKD